MRAVVRSVLAFALVAGGLSLAPTPALAVPEPSFRVVCALTRVAPDDPIVFPGQPGRSHLHNFFASQVTAATTVDSLLAQSSTNCSRGYGGVDFSGYWVPALLKNGSPVNSESVRVELAAYYKRAGGASGVAVKQAIPRGLRMIAGDMMAGGPQEMVYYKCAKNEDAGSQSKLGRGFPSCASDEMLIAELKFPDCWDGVNLDSANHKSHVAYSTGSDARCSASHPVKLPQLTFELWYHGVNGPASSLSWASGDQYSFHGDVISAWNTTAQANLVNQCINTARDCNPLVFGSVPVGAVSQAQLDAQLVGTMPGGNPSTGAPSTGAPSTTASSFTKIATPTVTGKARVGRKLTAKPGTWSPVPQALSYRWYRNGKAIKGATQVSYKLKKADRGKRIKVKVTATKSGYVTVVKASKATAKVR
mgnify:CR=1 FL=1